MNSLLVRHRALRSKNPNAFTLIELIVVIVIIGILAAVAAVAYNSFIAGADLSAKESTSVQTAKLIQAQSALDQSTQCSMDASRSGSGSQTNFTDLSFSSDIPTDVTTLNMTACNLSVVFDDGTVCSGVTFPTNTPGASYTGTWTCGDLTLPASSESVLTTAGNGTLLVSWTTPPDTGGSPVIEYTATTSPGGATCTAPAPDTSCTITGLQNGTSYTTTVTARTVAGTSEVSSSSNSSTPIGAPDAPTSPTPTAAPNAITVSWSAPASDGGSPITSYTATTNSGESCTVSAPATSCDITGLDYTLSYTVTVTATNIGGTSQASSQSASLNPGQQPEVAGIVNITNPEGGEIINFTAGTEGTSPITSYVASVIPSGPTLTVVSAVPAVGGYVELSDFTFDTDYIVSISAVNEVGQGEAASTNSFDFANPYNAATGGTITTISNYNGTGQTWKVHKFLSSGTLVVSSAPQIFRVLVVGGGGGSGWWNKGAGGGGGGMFTNDSLIYSTGSKAVTVGGSNAASSLAGVGTGSPGIDGSGGRVGNGGASGAPTAHAGGNGDNVYSSGGGGGAGGAGGSPRGYELGGVGGPGKANNITGSSTYYAGGGGGAHNMGIGNPAAPGGAGGGGSTDQNGTNGLGGGAGGASHGGWPKGGSGVVIIAYQIG